MNEKYRQVGTDLLTLACILFLWNEVELSWWIFACLFAAGTAINLACKMSTLKNGK